MKIVKLNKNQVNMIEYKSQQNVVRKIIPGTGYEIISTATDADAD